MPLTATYTVTHHVTFFSFFHFGVPRGHRPSALSPVGLTDQAGDEAAGLGRVRTTAAPVPQMGIFSGSVYNKCVKRCVVPAYEEPLVPELRPPPQRALYGRDVGYGELLPLPDQGLCLQGQVTVGEDHVVAVGDAGVGGQGKCGENGLMGNCRHRRLKLKFSRNLLKTNNPR